MTFAARIALSNADRRKAERDESDLWTDYQRLSYRCINLATHVSRLEMENRVLREIVQKQQRLIDVSQPRGAGEAGA